MSLAWQKASESKELNSLGPCIVNGNDSEAKAHNLLCGVNFIFKIQISENDFNLPKKWLIGSMNKLWERIFFYFNHSRNIEVYEWKQGVFFFLLVIDCW